MCAPLRVGREFWADSEQALLNVIVASPIVSHGPGDNDDDETKLEGEKKRVHIRLSISNPRLFSS